MAKLPTTSLTSKMSPNVYNGCPKMITLEKSFKKLLKNVGNLGKIMVARGFNKLPKVQ